MFCSCIHTSLNDTGWAKIYTKSRQYTVTINESDRTLSGHCTESQPFICEAFSTSSIISSEEIISVRPLSPENMIFHISWGIINYL